MPDDAITMVRRLATSVMQRLARVVFVIPEF
jgi:hypothetical protein